MQCAFGMYCHALRSGSINIKVLRIGIGDLFDRLTQGAIDDPKHHRRLLAKRPYWKTLETAQSVRRPQCLPGRQRSLGIIISGQLCTIHPLVRSGFTNSRKSGSSQRDNIASRTASRRRKIDSKSVPHGRKGSRISMSTRPQRGNH